MEHWQKKVDPYMSEKQLQRLCEDYLDILKRQGKVWHWHDRTNDIDLFNSIEKLILGCLPNESIYSIDMLHKNDFDKKLRKLLKRHRNKAGLPDLIVWVKTSMIRFDGKKCFMVKNVHTFELKSPKGTGKLTDGQKEFCQFLEDSTHTHHILNDFDEFKNIIDGLIN